MYYETSDMTPSLFSVSKTLLLMILIAATLAAVGLIGEAQNWPEHLRFYSFIALTAAYYIGMSRIRPGSESNSTYLSFLG